MQFSSRLIRDDALADALAALMNALGGEEPGDQALRIVREIQKLRSDTPAIVPPGHGVDYIDAVQREARADYLRQHGSKIGAATTATIATPIGKLCIVTWRKLWKGARLCWASEYYLDDLPVTLEETRRLGLAQRPTTRNRRKSS